MPQQIYTLYLAVPAIHHTHVQTCAWTSGIHASVPRANAQVHEAGGGGGPPAPPPCTIPVGGACRFRGEDGRWYAGYLTAVSQPETQATPVTVTARAGSTKADDGAAAGSGPQGEEGGAGSGLGLELLQGPVAHVSYAAPTRPYVRALHKQLLPHLISIGRFVCMVAGHQTPAAPDMPCASTPAASCSNCVLATAALCLPLSTTASFSRCDTI